MTGAFQSKSRKQKLPNTTRNVPSKQIKHTNSITTHPNTSTKGGDMSSEDKAAKEAHIQCALEAFHSGTMKSIRKASNTFNVPFATLQGRTKEHHSHSKGHESQQILTEAEEHSLIDWCVKESQKGRAWTCLDLQQHVYQMKAHTLLSPVLKCHNT
ncbi:hypothetical protein M422DRAFT_263676 [Sphaerobolus stellatus SS14]|uniref:HTH psq-type domain-containing protein n=1 Tax=Sphaerobolus stellatus (strain SS14) TaxID=990650 RepID=A0A0C9UY01_SPHS4|nr:hypothetical protein M422DRAFT_263676 [Sphaerobolus stellatus SS14]